jgi:hypothetical protein
LVAGVLSGFDRLVFRGSLLALEYHLSQDRNKRGLKLRARKCLHLYH